MPTQLEKPLLRHPHLEGYPKGNLAEAGLDGLGVSSKCGFCAPVIITGSLTGTSNLTHLEPSSAPVSQT